jgi:hypothetical protein
MKFSLRSLMIVAMVGPPLLAGCYFVLSACNIAELRTLVVFGLAALVLLGSLSSAFRGEI